MNRLRRYAPLLLLALVGGAVWASGAHRYLHMHDLREHAATLLALGLLSLAATAFVHRRALAGLRDRPPT